MGNENRRGGRQDGFAFEGEGGAAPWEADDEPSLELVQFSGSAVGRHIRIRCIYFSS